MHTARKRMRGLIAASALVPLLALAGCSANTAKTTAHPAPTDGVLTVGLLGDIGQPPDPDIYYANNGTALIINTYEGLVQYKNNVSDVQIAPRLATSWTVSPDKTVYTFKLRSGVTFHDGTPFTSAAVRSSFERRTQVNGGAAYMTAGIASVATPDDHTAVVTLKAPNSAFLDYLASPFGPKMTSPTTVAAHAGDDDGQTYLETHDAGTGPYEISDAEPGVKYELTQYPKYWGTRSPFTKVELPIYSDASAIQLALDKGEVDTVVAALPSSSIKKYDGDPRFSSLFLPTLQSALITLNPNKSFFATKQARLAFLGAIDQKKLVSEVLGKRSEPATTLYAKGMIPDGSDKQKIAYDPSVLKKYAASASDKKVTVGYATENVNAQAMANVLVAQLQADGLQATAQSYPTSEVFGWIQDGSKAPDAFIDGNNGPDGGSPYMWGHVFWDKSGGIDYFLCDVPKVDAMLDQALATGDTKLYAEAAQTYSANGCYYNLSYNKDWVVSQKWLTGVAASHNIGANELDFSKLGIAK